MNFAAASEVWALASQLVALSHLSFAMMMMMSFFLVVFLLHVLEALERSEAAGDGGYKHKWSFPSGAGGKAEDEHE